MILDIDTTSYYRKYKNYIIVFFLTENGAQCPSEWRT